MHLNKKKKCNVVKLLHDFHGLIHSASGLAQKVFSKFAQICKQVHEVLVPETYYYY